MGKIELKSKIINDDYTKYVYETFDIQDNEETLTTIDYSLGEAKVFEWNIGLILGSSGSGKTSILKKMGELCSPIFDYDKPLISNFDWLTPKEVSFLLMRFGKIKLQFWLGIIYFQKDCYYL